MRYFIIIMITSLFLSCKQEKKRYDVDEVEYYDPGPLPDSIPVKICGWASNFKYNIALAFDTSTFKRIVYLDTLRESDTWKEDYLNKRICAEGILIYRKGFRIKKWNVMKDGRHIPPPSGIIGDYPVLINYRWYLEK
jgi:hypothetical protein